MGTPPSPCNFPESISRRPRNRLASTARKSKANGSRVMRAVDPTPLQSFLELPRVDLTSALDLLFRKPRESSSRLIHASCVPPSRLHCKAFWTSPESVSQATREIEHTLRPSTCQRLVKMRRMRTLPTAAKQHISSSDLMLLLVATCGGWNQAGSHRVACTHRP